MCANGRTAMERKLLVRQSNHRGRPYRLLTAALSLLFAFALGRPAAAQQVAVTGTVTNPGGQPLRGVAVQVQGTATRVFTDATGKYAVAAPTNGILDFTLLGQRSVQLQVRGQSRIDVEMTPIAFLQEMVVTAYAE